MVDKRRERVWEKGGERGGKKGKQTGVEKERETIRKMPKGGGGGAKLQYRESLDMWRRKGNALLNKQDTH